MRLVVFSDTHTHHRKLVLPDGDVLIGCGDYSYQGEREVLLDFINWMEDQKHPHKIVVMGNHDRTADPKHIAYTPNLYEGLMKDKKIHYLFNSGVQIDGINFWGSPYIPNLPMWAFHDGGKNKFEDVPPDVNVMITHGPPHRIRDYSMNFWGEKSHYGSVHLLNCVKNLKQLKAHCFGHCHLPSGCEEIDGVKYINASICNEKYEPVRSVCVVEI